MFYVHPYTLPCGQRLHFPIKRVVKKMIGSVTCSNSVPNYFQPTMYDWHILVSQEKRKDGEEGGRKEEKKEEERERREENNFHIIGKC